MDRPYITLFSTPLVSTWVFDETRRILFDVGDGAAACLDQRVAKVKTVALTHSHRDHIGGLLQFMNLRGGAGDLLALYPSGSGAIKAYAGFLSMFDRGSSSQVQWREFGDREELVLPDERLVLRAFRNLHVDANNEPAPKSVGYQLIRRVDKLRPEYQTLSQTELDAIRIEKGRSALVSQQDKLIFAISGDTAPLDPALYRDCDYLLHECTFLDEEDGDEYRAREHGHSVLGEVLEMAMQAQVGHLGLYHVSRRYDNAQIRARILEMCANKNVPFPVSVAFPGITIEDFFKNSLWKGAKI